jgi:hypothetical protein
MYVVFKQIHIKTVHLYIITQPYVSKHYVELITRPTGNGYQNMQTVISETERVNVVSKAHAINVSFC